MAIFRVPLYVEIHAESREDAEDIGADLADRIEEDERVEQVAVADHDIQVVM